jgi:hypothetical protein
MSILISILFILFMNKKEKLEDSDYFALFFFMVIITIISYFEQKAWEIIFK